MPERTFRIRILDCLHFEAVVHLLRRTRLGRGTPAAGQGGDDRLSELSLAQDLRARARAGQAACPTPPAIPGYTLEIHTRAAGAGAYERRSGQNDLALQFTNTDAARGSTWPGVQTNS